MTGWESFEPWLSRVEAMEAAVLWAIAEEVPPEWYGGDTAVIERLMETMLERRGTGAGVDCGVSGFGPAAIPKVGRRRRRIVVRGESGEGGAEMRLRFVM